MKKRDIKSKLLIFDFDGTIADTKAIYYRAIHKQVKVFGYKYRDIDNVIDFGLSLKKTLKKLGFSFLIRLFLQKRIMKNVKKSINQVKKCRDTDSIKGIKEEKILVTNSLKEFVMPIIKHFKLKKEFREIYGAEDFSDKAEFIKQYINKRKLRKQECYYIGDRVADIKTAKKAGCKSVIIIGKCAWDSKKELLKKGPDFIIESLADLEKIL
jgi:phosphoglycolate phosphatase